MSHSYCYFTIPISLPNDTANMTLPVMILRDLRGSTRELRYDEFRAKLVSAELTGALPELYALCFHAILALAEGSEFARDYVEMAEITASTAYERALVASIRLACDGPGGFRIAKAPSCTVVLDTEASNPTTWRNLLLALGEPGDAQAIDAAQDPSVDRPPAAGSVDHLQWKNGARAHQP